MWLLSPSELATDGRYKNNNNAGCSADCLAPAFMTLRISGLRHCSDHTSSVLHLDGQRKAVYLRFWPHGDRCGVSARPPRYTSSRSTISNAPITRGFT